MDNNRNKPTAGTQVALSSKYAIGDVFSRKGERDGVPVKIVSVEYGVIEAEYTLAPIRYCGNAIVLGEAALDELYVLVKK